MVNIFFAIVIVLGSVLGYSAFTEKFEESERGMYFQDAHSPVMEDIIQLHDLLLIMCIAIPTMVISLLIYTSVRFSRKNNPKPSTFTHNTKLEIVWTVIPCIILTIIAFPSIKLLYFMDKAVDAEMTIKVVGYQWYWGYEYPDHDNIAFESYMIPDDEIDKEKGQVRLLETDNQIVLPVNTNVRVLVTSADVIHSWAMPSLGVKMDAIPGRLNETWVNIDEPGIYRGQCSELCGVNHAYMPIVIRAVSKENFEKWVEKAKEEFADGSDSLTQKKKLTLAYKNIN